MFAVILWFACFAACVAGFTFVDEAFGRAVLAVSVLGMLVLETHERAGGG